MQFEQKRRIFGGKGRGNQRGKVAAALGRRGRGDKAPPLRKAKMSVKLEMTGEHRWEMETETEHETET